MQKKLQILIKIFIISYKNHFTFCTNCKSLPVLYTIRESAIYANKKLC